MLSDKQKLENKLKYIELLGSIGVDLTEFAKYLDHIDFFEKPATTSQFRAYRGGLCQCAIDTYFELSQLCNAYMPGRYSNEDIIKVSLLKDIYRAELFEETTINRKSKETGQWVEELCFRTKDVKNRPTFGEMNFSSYMIVKHFFPLTDEQVEAIMYSSEFARADDINDVLRSYPLVALTKMANIAVSYLEEGEN